MKVVRPVVITDTMLISSSVAEDDYAAWAGGTTYAVGDRVIRAHIVWESLAASNIGHDPSANPVNGSGVPYWLEVSSTNRWRMFDATVNSQTTASGEVVVELQPGAINAVGAIELEGSTIRVQLFDGATLVYDRIQNIDNTPIDDWYDYFFEPRDPAASVLFEGVPSYMAGRVVITIANPSGGAVACGGVVLGAVHELGGLQPGATSGITDYSRKTTNDFGVTSIVERPFSKRSSMRLWLTTAEVRRTYGLLSGLRATPSLWVGDEDTFTYAPLVIYGYFRDFQIEIPGPVISYCSIEIEGMI